MRVEYISRAKRIDKMRSKSPSLFAASGKTGHSIGVWCGIDFRNQVLKLSRTLDSCQASLAVTGKREIISRQRRGLCLTRGGLIGVVDVFHSDLRANFRRQTKTTIITNKKRTSWLVKRSRKLNLFETKPACMAGVRISLPNVKAI